VIGQGLIALALTEGLALTSAAAYGADCSYEEQVSYVWGQPQVSLVYTCPGDSASIDAAPASVTQQDLAVANCLDYAAELLLIPPFCLPSPGEESAEVTPAIVASAFARIPLPASKLMVQPPNGRTLVNFATNFYTETEPFTRSVTLLGQRVELSIRPAAFAWRFGDGESTSTSSPGSAYPDLEITHAYLRKGRFAPSVDTTYTATYRVLGGPAQPVPGSVTIPGESVSLEVVSASPRLVG
jgi:hypothetical protein